MTRHDVDDAAAAGHALTLGPRDVLTHEAAQRARDLGVAVMREGRTAASGDDDDRLRRAVRAAVIAELGREPDGLDAAIDRVMRSHGSAR